MADGILLKRGAGFDNTGLTATAADIKPGKIFLGAGSKEAQTGTMPIISTVTKKMSVNESYTIQAGYHGGSDRIYQEGVPVEVGQTIDPGSGGITINVTGKYLTSNTYVQSVDNLRPEVIKKGVIIGDITGTYEGFPDEE